MNKYLIRHKILEYLIIERSRNKRVDEICEHIGFNEYEVEVQLIYLVHADEVEKYYISDHTERYSISEIGKVAVSDEKYLKAYIEEKIERNTEHRATLAARVSLVSTVMGFTLAAFSLGISTCNTIKSAKGIDQINNKLDSVLKTK
jgi:hypothetical protein